MAYRLDARETLPQGIRRIVSEQLDGAVEGVRTATGDERDRAVHDARKRLKKSRAVLRLVRDEVGSKTYKRENQALRDVGRSLSASRDAAVLVETVDRLDEQVPLARRSLAPLRLVLEQRRRETAARALDDDGALATAADEIEEIRARVEGWRLPRDGFSALEDGLRRTYHRGSKRFAEAHDDPTDKRMHEARKRVKDLWYHARILEPVWPGPMDQLVEATDELGDRLGEDHDLAVLADTVRALAREGADGGAGETALTLVENRRAELRAEVWPLGRRVYADKPKPFVRRMRILYRTWRDEHVWQLSPESAERVRELLETREVGDEIEQRRAGERLRRHGIHDEDLAAHLPQRNGASTPVDFDDLVKHGRVRVQKQKT
jgi:CHAD domain-containing protein